MASALTDELGDTIDCGLIITSTAMPYCRPGKDPGFMKRGIRFPMAMACMPPQNFSG